MGWGGVGRWGKGGTAHVVILAEEEAQVGVEDARPAAALAAAALAPAADHHTEVAIARQGAVGLLSCARHELGRRRPDADVALDGVDSGAGQQAQGGEERHLGSAAAPAQQQGQGESGASSAAAKRRRRDKSEGARSAHSPTTKSPEAKTKSVRLNSGG